MRLSKASALLAAAALSVCATAAEAGSSRGRERDCTPTNGPFGFYGNIWCQPANEASYMRNLGASWPMNTPPSMRQKRKVKTGSDW